MACDDKKNRISKFGKGSFFSRNWVFRLLVIPNLRNDCPILVILEPPHYFMKLKLLYKKIYFFQPAICVNQKCERKSNWERSIQLFFEKNNKNCIVLINAMILHE